MLCIWAGHPGAQKEEPAMISGGDGRKRPTSLTPRTVSRTTPAVRRVALALLALAALAGLSALIGLAAGGASAAGPAQTRYFTLPQARAFPGGVDSRSGNAPGGPWQAPPIAPRAVMTNNWTNL